MDDYDFGEVENVGAVKRKVCASFLITFFCILS
jgi:hypothetical protein